MPSTLVFLFNLINPIINIPLVKYIQLAQHYAFSLIKIVSTSDLTPAVYFYISFDTEI